MPRKVYTDEDKAEAFKVWVRTGSFNKTAKEVGIGRDTLSRWAKEQDWYGRLERIKLNVARNLDPTQQDIQQDNPALRQAIENLAEEEARDLRIVNTLLGSVVQILRNRQVLYRKVGDVYEPIELPPVIPRTWGDLINTVDKMLKHKRLILGEPTERIDLNVVVGALTDAINRNISDPEVKARILRTFEEKLFGLEE